LLLLSAAFDVLRCAAEDFAPAQAAGAGAARSAVVMGQCLLAALTQARALPRHAMTGLLLGCPRICNERQAKTCP